jgi:hypothetical protein
MSYKPCAISHGRSKSRCRKCNCVNVMFSLNSDSPHATQNVILLVTCSVKRSETLQYENFDYPRTKRGTIIVGYWKHSWSVINSSDCFQLRWNIRDKLHFDSESTNLSSPNYVMVKDSRMGPMHTNRIVSTYSLRFPFLLSEYEFSRLLIMSLLTRFIILYTPGLTNNFPLRLIT